MEMVETHIQVRLHLTKEQKGILKKSCKLYLKCLNAMSKCFFEHDFSLTEKSLKKQAGKKFLEKFRATPLVASATKEVLSKYKAEKQRLSSEVYSYQGEKGIEKIAKDLSWLKKPIEFKEEHIYYESGMLWKFRNNYKQVVFTCFGSRIRCGISYKNDEKLSNDDRKAAKIVCKRKGNEDVFYLLIPTEKRIEATESPFVRNSATTVVGIDIGERFIITAYDGEKTIFVSGKELAEKAKKYQQQKAELTGKNSQKAREKLKAVTQKERNWICNINHKIAKDLVDSYGKQTVFVFEDLPHSMFQSKSRLWFLERLEKYFKQKISARGGYLLKVSAQYTSQRCPYCGKISKKQRNHNKHEYRCSCGFRTNDDRVSAINLHELGQRWLEGETNPRIVLPDVIQ